MELNRKQFLVHTGTAVGAVALAGMVRARSADADAPPQLAKAQLAVVAGLTSAILVAVGVTAEPSQVELITPVDLAQSFSSIDPEVQAQILGVLEAVEQSPPSGPFSSLSDAQRQAFLRKALEPVRVTGNADLAFDGALKSDFAAFITQTNNGKVPSESQGISRQFVDSDPPDPPDDLAAPPEEPPPPTPAYLAQAVTVLQGLQLVAFPLPKALPATPAVPNVDIVSALTTLLPLNNLGALDDTIDQLIDQLVSQVDSIGDPDEPIPLIPSPLLPQATAALLS